MKKIFSVLIILVFFTSCDKLITTLPESRLPTREEKLVVYSMISPQDTLVSVWVSLSKPIFTEVDPAILVPVVVGGDTISYIEKGLNSAQVILNDGQKDLILPYNIKQNKYSGKNDLKNPFIVVGKTYTLKVIANGMSAEASTSIPNEIPQLELLDFTLKKNTGFQTNYENSLKLRANDTENLLNYALFASSVSIDSVPLVDKNGNKTGKFKVNNIENRIFFDDFRSFSSTNYKLPIEILGTGNINGGSAGNTKDPYFSRLYVDLRKTDKNYFEYERFRRSNRSGNPFTEPTPLFSNIKGGLGVFGSYNSNIKIVKATKGKIVL